MSHTWLVRLPPRTDDRSRVDDAAATAGLRGGVVAEKPVVALGDSRLDCARLDPEDRRHSAAVERGGVLRSMRVGGRNGSGVERYQLHAETEDGELQAVSRPWRQFEFIPKQQSGAVVIAQLGSPNLLYSTLPEDGGESASMVYLFGSHNAAVSTLAVDVSGTNVVSGAEDGSIAVWRISDGEKIGSISAAHEGGVRAVAIASPTCVISSGNDGCVRVWLVSGDPRLRMLHKMSTGPAPLASLAFWSGEKGQLLASGSEDGTVFTWSAEPASNMQEFGWRAAAVSHDMVGLDITHFSFRSDGAALVVGGGEPHHAGKGEVRLFETEHWTSVANTSYSSGIVGCEYSRNPTLIDLAMVCSAAGAPKLLEGRLTPAVTAALREKGMGADIPLPPLGHGPLPAETGRDGSGIRIVTEDGEPAVVADEHEPRAKPPPTPSAKGKDETRGSRRAGANGPDGVRRPAFSRSGKVHVEPDTTPSERATRIAAKMAVEVMSRAHNDEEEDPEEMDEDVNDVLEGVSGTETDLARPSLMSSRPLLQRNALIPFAVFDKDTELEHHMKPLGVTGREEAAKVADTHVRAMAAANMDISLPRNARRFEGLKQIPQEASETTKRLVGKQLDPRWLAVRDIRPRMEDMWVAARREPQVCSTEGWSSGTLLVPPSEGIEF